MLSVPHLEQLKASAISEAVIKARGYETVTAPSRLKKLGFALAQANNVPGLLIPLHSTDGKQPLCIYRPDNPRVHEDKDKPKDKKTGKHPHKVIKYEMPKGAEMRVDCPPHSLPDIGNPNVPLFITEGQKKADALVSKGGCAVALLGVWNFIGTNRFGGKTFLADFDFIAFNKRWVAVVYDSDVMQKTSVRKALERLVAHLQRKGAEVVAIYLPNDGDKKLGVDDWLAKGKTLDDLISLADGPRPAPRAAPKKFELLDAPPAVIERPLQLINGTAYATTYLYGQQTTFEYTDAKGEVRRLPEPRIEQRKRRFVVAHDRRIWADDEIDAVDTLPVSKLGMTVRVGDTQLDNHLWSKGGVGNYRASKVPDPLDVFGRVCSVIGRFVDLEASFANVGLMTQMLACFVMHTWFLDAYPSACFLWLTGGAGSGKSTLMLVLCEMGFCGQAISPSTTFSSMRDLADAGALIAVDDAERLSDPKKTPPEIREMILSGNRKGVFILYKENNPATGAWEQRRANVFGGRVFTAIARPDAVLSSRCIVVPLARTTDKLRGNADIYNPSHWPCDKRELTDDLWAMTLHYLPEMPKHVAKVQLDAVLLGRDMQPWLGILSVAHWLNQFSPGLYGEMCEVASSIYQREREQMEQLDWHRLVASAVYRYSKGHMVLNCAKFTASTICDVLSTMARENEIDDTFSTKSVGRAISALRVMTVNEAVRPREWSITQSGLDRLVAAYQLEKKQ